MSVSPGKQWYAITAHTSASASIENYVQVDPAYIEDHLDERRQEGRTWGDGYRGHTAEPVPHPPREWVEARLRDLSRERERIVVRYLELHRTLEEIIWKEFQAEQRGEGES